MSMHPFSSCSSSVSCRGYQPNPASQIPILARGKRAWAAFRNVLESRRGSRDLLITLSSRAHLSELFPEHLKEPEGAVDSAVRAEIGHSTGRVAAAPSVCLGVGKRCHMSAHSWSESSVSPACNMGLNFMQGKIHQPCQPLQEQGWKAKKKSQNMIKNCYVRF